MNEKGSDGCATFFAVMLVIGIPILIGLKALWDEGTIGNLVLLAAVIWAAYQIGKDSK